MTATINDSLKIIPFPVSGVAKAFNLPFSKLDIDYHKERSIDYTPTKDEIQYLLHDCKIVGEALHQMFEMGMTKMTAASNSLSAFKDTVKGRKFRDIFPIIDCDGDIRESYRGGYTYCSPRIKGEVVGPGLVFDVNSLYPSVMRNCKLPFGEPKRYDGEYKPDKIYDLYVQYIRCQFELNPDHVPTIQIKKSFRFAEHEYVESSFDEEVVLCLTSVDLELFLKHYDVYNLEYIGGYKFMSTDQLFKDFVDHWTEVKINSELEGNAGMRTLAKLIMNSLYGKWAVSPSVSSSLPYLDGELVKYELGPEEQREPLYIPSASFITAYARSITINAVQANYDRFCYCDTDSIHLEGIEPPTGIEIHDTKLGAWDHELTFEQGKFLRAKCYMEIGREPGKEERIKKVTVAGMSDKIHQYVTLDNFNLGVKFSSTEHGFNVIRIKPEHSNLRPKRVPGGIVLEARDFTLQI